MKPVPRRDYAVSARPYALEFPESASHLADAYWLELNNEITVAFLPAFGVPVEDIQFPADIDAPASRLEALSLVALETRYVVTPDGARAGQTIRLQPTEANDGATTVFFFVTNAEYAALLPDLEAMHEVTCGVHSSAHLRSEFVGNTVIRIIDERFVPSPFLDPYSRALLPLRPTEPPR